MPVIDTQATGINIKNMIKARGFKIADVQRRCGFNTPQAIFKWMRGDAVPTIDNVQGHDDGDALLLGAGGDEIIVVKMI